MVEGKYIMILIQTTLNVFNENVTFSRKMAIYRINPTVVIHVYF